MSNRVDLNGKVFSYLTVISFKDGKNICQCRCGNTTNVRTADLNNGNTKSCGCYHREITSLCSISHSHTVGKGYTPEYTAWCHIKSRCYNKNVWNYNNYGGRGIIVCDRWKNSFENFLSDMGVRPSKNHSIDRYPNINGNYEPNNCRWATKIEQSRGVRTNKWLECNGEIMVLTDWAIKLNTFPSNINRMLNKKSFSEVVNFYINKKHEKKNFIQ